MKAPRNWGTLDPFVETGAIVGRTQANAAFLRALLSRDPFDGYCFFLDSRQTSKRVEDLLAGEFPGIAGEGRFVFELRQNLPRYLREHDFHCFHLSDCVNYPAHLARLRNRHARWIFPITSITHSLSYGNYCRKFLAHLWPGMTGRDAVITSSQAGLEVMRGFYGHLRRCFGLSPDVYKEPRLEVVPLGVDTQYFQPPTKSEKSELREGLAIMPGKVAILVFARISHHSKMDVLPLFRAFSRLFASGLDRERVVLLFGGWVDEGDNFPESLRNLAANVGLECRIVPRPSEEEKRNLFRASDIFVSPVDNVQETFGLTLLEAGASGLPCVVSDYDGYRDIVADGETGFLVETYGVSGGDAAFGVGYPRYEDSSGMDALAQVLYDNQYHLMLAERVAVSVPGLASGLGELISDGSIREAMGRAAVSRIRRHFSWESVIEHYLGLWDELSRVEVDADSLRDIVHPLHVPYDYIFSGYPTRALEDDVILGWTAAGQAVYRGRDFPVVYAGIEHLVTADVLKKLLFLSRGGVSYGDLRLRLTAVCGWLTQGEAGDVVLWALKHDFLEVVDGNSGRQS